jgi:hypothetical protein
MKRSCLAIGMLLLASGCSRHDDVYRSIEVRDVHVVLGERFQRFQQAERVTDSLFVVHPDAVIDAGIRIFVRPDTVVRAIELEYAASDSYDALVSEYTWRLGPPYSRQMQNMGVNDAISTTTWRDRHTDFVIRWAPHAAERQLTSRMTDRLRHQP